MQSKHHAFTHKNHLPFILWTTTNVDKDISEVNAFGLSRGSRATNKGIVAHLCTRMLKHRILILITPNQLIWEIMWGDLYYPIMTHKYVHPGIPRLWLKQAGTVWPTWGLHPGLTLNVSRKLAPLHTTANGPKPPTRDPSFSYRPPVTIRTRNHGHPEDRSP